MSPSPCEQRSAPSTVVWWDAGPALLFWSILGLVCVQRLSLILTAFQL